LGLGGVLIAKAPFEVPFGDSRGQAFGERPRRRVSCRDDRGGGGRFLDLKSEGWVASSGDVFGRDSGPL